MARLWASLILLVLATPACAGQWAIPDLVGTQHGPPAYSVPVPITFSGDGTTTASTVDLDFDETTFFVAPIPLAGASCTTARVGSNLVLRVRTPDGSPLPPGQVEYCRVWFRMHQANSLFGPIMRVAGVTCSGLSGAPVTPAW